MPDIDTVELPMGRFPEPKCFYKVRLVNRYGPTVSRQVYVGEPLYHHWYCDYGNRDANLYCMMIQKCTVTDGNPGSAKVRIIDDLGCSLFPNLIPDVVYHGDLDAGMQISAFSMDVDKPAVEFNCSIRLALKQNGNCYRPICDSVHQYLNTKTSHKMMEP